MCIELSKLLVNLICDITAVFSMEFAFQNHFDAQFKGLRI